VEEHASRTSDADASAPWYLRALPVTVLLAALVAAATLLIPGFRDEVARSTTRDSQPFIEMFFPQDRTGAPVVCTRDGENVRVRVVISSHLERRTWLGVRTSLLPANGPAAERTGSILLSPGETAMVSHSFRRPDGASTVTVRLPARGQRLHARCTGAVR